MTTIHWSTIGAFSNFTTKKTITLTAEVVVLVVKGLLNSNNISRICRSSTDTSHDGDENVLLDRERSGIDGHAEDLDIWAETSPSTTHWVGEQLGDNAGDGDRGISEKEELIQAL